MTSSVDIETESQVSSEKKSAVEHVIADWREPISVARWVVYFQAAMLGLVATIFFIFGLIVGSFNSSYGHSNDVFDCRIVGSVTYRTESGNLLADHNSVVVLIPRDKKPDRRSQGKWIHPESFEPLDNQGIDTIHSLGGAVVRTDENGDFDLFVDGKQNEGVRYFLLIISKNHLENDRELTKQQAAAIGTFFMPVENVARGHSIHWLPLNADQKRVDLAVVEF
ncbi:MAG: hypothetical protein AAF623_05630 [Planctomycetota bacterium]